MFSLIRELTGVQAGAENIVRRKIFFFPPWESLLVHATYEETENHVSFILGEILMEVPVPYSLPILGFNSIWHIAESLKETWDRRTVAITPFPP